MLHTNSDGIDAKIEAKRQMQTSEIRQCEKKKLGLQTPAKMIGHFAAKTPTYGSGNNNPITIELRSNRC